MKKFVVVSLVSSLIIMFSLLGIYGISNLVENNKDRDEIRTILCRDRSAVMQCVDMEIK